MDSWSRRDKIKTGVGRHIGLYNPLFIFFLSVTACTFMLTIERLLGIEWDFHPDAVTYIETSINTISTFGLRDIQGASFYLLVDLFDSKISLIIIFNILVYSITNVMLARFYYKSIGYRQANLTLILFLLVIFNPYRIHLSVQVLKDTIIIFGMVYFLVGRMFSWLGFITTYLISTRSIIYLATCISKGKILVYLIPIICFIVFYLGPDVFLSLLSTEGQVDMSFRAFDSVPNFIEFGVLGAVMRSILWPFIYLTGTFIFISPTIMYFPIAIGSFFLQIWHFQQYKKLTLYFQVYLAMGLFAFLTPGFTSYIRWVLPLITLLPIFVIKNDVVHYNKRRNIKVK